MAAAASSADERFFDRMIPDGSTATDDVGRVEEELEGVLFSIDTFNGGRWRDLRTFLPLAVESIGFKCRTFVGGSELGVCSLEEDENTTINRCVKEEGKVTRRIMGVFL